MKKQDFPQAEAALDQPDNQEPKDYEVNDAMETLLRAEEHKKNPKLMAKVHQKLGAKKQAITSIQGLKDRRQQLVDSDKDGQ